MKDDTPYCLQGGPMIHAPGIFRWCMRFSSHDINEEARDEAAKLYFLASTWPGMPAGALLDLARNEEAFTVTLDEEANEVTITRKEKA